MSETREEAVRELVRTAKDILAGTWTGRRKMFDGSIRELRTVHDLQVHFSAKLNALESAIKGVEDTQP